jgi:hypothetical protein
VGRFDCNSNNKQTKQQTETETFPLVDGLMQCRHILNGKLPSIYKLCSNANIFMYNSGVLFRFLGLYFIYAVHLALAFFVFGSSLYNLIKFR